MSSLQPYSSHLFRSGRLRNGRPQASRNTTAPSSLTAASLPTRAYIVFDTAIYICHLSMKILERRSYIWVPPVCKSLEWKGWHWLNVSNGGRMRTFKQKTTMEKMKFIPAMEIVESILLTKACKIKTSHPESLHRRKGPVETSGAA